MRALLLQLRLEVFDGKAPGIELGFLCRRVDFHQQLAFLDRIASLDVNLLNLPRSLCADIHVAARLQGAERRHAVFDIAPADLHSGNGVATRWQHLPGSNSDHGNQTKGGEQRATGGAGTIHAGFRPVVAARRKTRQTQGLSCKRGMRHGI